MRLKMFNSVVLERVKRLTVIAEELLVQDATGSLHCCVCDPDTSYPEATALGPGMQVFP